MEERKMFFILNPRGEPLPVDDAVTWGKWFEENPGLRRVDFTEFKDEFNTVVSTVFIGLDMNLSARKEDGFYPDPMVFESMVFSDNPDYDGYQWRYSTKDRAQEGHDYIVQEIYKQQLSNGVRKRLKLNFNIINPNTKE